MRTDLVVETSTRWKYQIRPPGDRKIITKAQKRKRAHSAHRNHAGVYPGQPGRGTRCTHSHTIPLTTHTTQPVNERKRPPLSDEKTGDLPRPNAVANLSLLQRRDTCDETPTRCARPGTALPTRSSVFTQGLMALMQPIICCVRAQSARDFVTEFSGDATPNRSGVAQRTEL